FRVSSAPRPRAIRSRPRGPKTVLAYDWVATAPTPARAHDTTAPTARNLDATATPRSPVSASNPTIEKVDGRTVMSASSSCSGILEPGVQGVPQPVAQQ